MDNNQEVVRLLRRREHALEEHFILPLPYAWLRTLKDAIDHSQRMIRVEASNAIESHMTDSPGRVPDLPTDGNSFVLKYARAQSASDRSGPFQSASAKHSQSRSQ